jgi:hypothetical protein
MDVNKDQTASVAVERCVFLGLLEDPQTALGFPSIWNYCHKARPAGSVALAYQRDFCQAAAYCRCQLIQEPEARRLPSEARSQSGASSAFRRGQGVGLVFLFLALLAAGVVLGWMLNTGFLRARLEPIASILPPTGVHAPIQETSTETEAAVPSAEIPTDTFVVTGNEPTAALLPGAESGLCGYQLDEIIHAERDFIIHRARGGENLSQYAGEHKTSVEAILAANHALPVPLHIDWVLVIPVETLDLRGLPPFEPYFESAEGVSLASLAATLSVEEILLRKYNGFDPKCTTISGWLLVPRIPTP